MPSLTNYGTDTVSSLTSGGLARPVTSAKGLLDTTSFAPRQQNAVATAPVETGTTNTQDYRIRLSALADKADQVYGPNDTSSNALACLYNTNGLMFPYQPQVSVSQDVSYISHDLIHSNADILSYQRTPSPTIQVTGKFTVQNQREGEYAFAAIHFLRTVSKMWFGRAAGNNAGMPPPVLRFSGYGDMMFNDIRCVVKSHNYGFDENINMVSVNLSSGGTVRLPVMFTLSISLGLQTTPKRMRNEFDLNSFRTGALLKSSSGWF